MFPDDYRIRMEVDAFKADVRRTLARFVRILFAILALVAFLLLLAERRTALEMAQAFARYASSEIPGVSSQAALCLCPGTMQAFAREGERAPNGIEWHTTEDNPEILFRSLQGSSHLEEAWSHMTLLTVERIVDVINRHSGILLGGEQMGVLFFPAHEKKSARSLMMCFLALKCGRSGRLASLGMG